MRLHKFSDVDAFVALDLPGAEAASGPVRWARKILQGGAKDLARSQTYTYAALQMRRSGASAGISAEAPLRAEAVASFVAEAAALVPDGTYLPDAAKGVGDQDLAPLRDGDPRTVARLGAFAAQCDALSAAAAADAAAGLDGRTVAIEGLSATGAALASEVAARGGRVVAVSSAEGALAAPHGFDPTALSEAWQAHGDKALSAMAGRDDGLDRAEALWGEPADVVFAGSKMGVVHHGVAEGLGCRALVPGGRLAYTSKALARVPQDRHRCGARLRGAGRIHRRRLEQPRHRRRRAPRRDRKHGRRAHGRRPRVRRRTVSGRLLPGRSVPDHLAGRAALRPPASLLTARSHRRLPRLHRLPPAGGLPVVL